MVDLGGSLLVELRLLDLHFVELDFVRLALEVARLGAHGLVFVLAGLELAFELLFEVVEVHCGVVL